MIRLDPDLIRHALTTASERGYASVEISLGDDRFEAHLLPRRAKPTSEPRESRTAEQDYKLISATAVGYFQFGKKPLSVGQEVHQGDVVAEVVSLGLSNDIVSKWTGTIKDLLVAPGQPVEYGQPIAHLELKSG